MVRQRDRARIAILIVFFALAVAGLSLPAEQPQIVVGAFSSAQPGLAAPPDWQDWILKNVKRRTSYRLVSDEATVVRARANASASGLRRDITIDPREYPILRWRWKVAGIIEKADISKKKANDSPARIYVAFSYDIDRLPVVERLKYAAAKKIYSDSLPLRALAYTWANRTARGAFVPMPYTSWFMQVAVENRTSAVDRWLTEERDVFRDYRQAFGEDPKEITGVAIMTNTDNLHGEATAWYGDIVFARR